jgi:hypothetical protein
VGRLRRAFSNLLRRLGFKHTFDNITITQNPYCALRDHEYIPLLDYVHEGVLAVRRGDYRKAGDHFTNEALKESRFGSFMLSVDTATVNSPIPETMDGLRALYESHFTDGETVSGEGVVHINKLVFTQKPQTAAQKRIVAINDYSIAMKGLEEWLHAVQRSCGTYLSEGLKLYDALAEYESGYFARYRSEVDIAQFYIEQGIPLPENFIEMHEIRKQTPSLSQAKWSSFPLVRWQPPAF